jgi:hypothetical protein
MFNFLSKIQKYNQINYRWNFAFSRINSFALAINQTVSLDLVQLFRARQLERLNTLKIPNTEETNDRLSR